MNIRSILQFSLKCVNINMVYYDKYLHISSKISQSVVNKSALTQTHWYTRGVKYMYLIIIRIDGATFCKLVKSFVFDFAR